MPELDLPTWQRITLLLVVVALAHGLVGLIRKLSERAMASSIATQVNKTRTVISLVTSVVVFSLYFAAVGLVLNEIGVSLTTYFASASIIGLAVAFGSQGLVQDVVSGLTIVFTDLFDIGDIVEVSGQVGVVEKFGMRFTQLRNPMGATVFVPNRSIANVVTYPRGYIRSQMDVVLPADEEKANAVRSTVQALVDSVMEQFPGIFRAPAEITGSHRTTAGKEYLRVKFRIWPGRGGPLESSLRPNLLQAIKKIEPDYADWMVSINYEIETWRPPRRAGSRWRLP